MILRLTCAAADLDVRAVFLEAKAPRNVAFLRGYLSTPRVVPGLHAMWTGPEISCPIPAGHLDSPEPLPPENATLHPQPGDIVMAYVPPRVWGGNPDPIFDIGVFYGPGARMFFPIGWLAGSVTAQVIPEDLTPLAAACTRIRRSGACEITFALEG